MTTNSAETIMFRRTVQLLISFIVEWFGIGSARLSVKKKRVVYTLYNYTCICGATHIIAQVFVRQDILYHRRSLGAVIKRYELEALVPRGYRWWLQSASGKRVNGTGSSHRRQHSNKSWVLFCKWCGRIIIIVVRAIMNKWHGVEPLYVFVWTMKWEKLISILYASWELNLDSK